MDSEAEYYLTLPFFIADLTREEVLYFHLDRKTLRKVWGSILEKNSEREIRYVYDSFISMVLQSRQTSMKNAFNMMGNGDSTESIEIIAKTE